MNADTKYPAFDPPFGDAEYPACCNCAHFLFHEGDQGACTLRPVGGALDPRRIHIVVRFEARESDDSCDCFTPITTARCAQCGEPRPLASFPREGETRLVICEACASIFDHAVATASARRKAELEASREATRKWSAEREAAGDLPTDHPPF